MPFAAGFWGTHIASGAALAVYWSALAAASFSFMLLFLALTRANGRLLVAPMGRSDWTVRLAGALVRTAAFAAGAWLAATGQVTLSWFAWALIPAAMAMRRSPAPKPRAPKRAPRAPA
jgi:hypothetical protein